MNIDRLLRFLTEEEKNILHYLYPNNYIDVLDFKQEHTVNGLVNLGFVELGGKTEVIYKLSDRGREFCKLILFGT